MFNKRSRKAAKCPPTSRGKIPQSFKSIIHIYINFFQHPFIKNCGENKEVMQKVLQEADELIEEYLNSHDPESSTNSRKVTRTSSLEQRVEEISKNLNESQIVPNLSIKTSETNIQSPTNTPKENLSPNLLDVPPQKPIPSSPESVAPVKQEKTPKLANSPSQEPQFNKKDSHSSFESGSPGSSPKHTATLLDGESAWIRTILEQYEPPSRPNEKFGSTKRIKKLQKRKTSAFNVNKTLAEIIEEDKEQSLGKTLQSIMEEETKKLEQHIDQGIFLAASPRTRREFSGGSLSSGNLTPHLTNNSTNNLSNNNANNNSHSSLNHYDNSIKSLGNPVESPKGKKESKSKRLSRFLGIGKK